MIYVDAKYASMLAPRVRNFKQQKDYLWNFSCPICGDSKKDKSKARGYIYRKDTSLFYKCHNCGYGSSLGNLIKEVDSRMYSEYSLEKFGATNNKHVNDKPDLSIFKEDTPLKVSNLKHANFVSTLDDSHPIKKFLRRRHINQDLDKHFFWVPRFKEWVNENIVMKFHTIKSDEPRLVIPFFDEDKNLIALQGRGFGNEEPKYYTLKVKEDNHKVFGLDRLDKDRHVYVVEGPIDSLFLDNCLAVAGATFDVPQVEQFKDNCTIVFDNEPRNKELVKQIEKVINKGYRVCLWNDSIREKDINDMIMAGKTPLTIHTLIEHNSVQGAEAVAKFNLWRKI